MNFKNYWMLYMYWMCENVKLPCARYEMLAKLLHNIPFRSPIRSDKNRISDAIKMRQEWCSENEVIFDIPDNMICNGSCSVLELLVSFARRIDRDFTSVSVDDEPYIMFDHFLENLDLYRFTDSAFSKNEDRVYDYIIQIINRWMDGDIDSRGHGGLFPLEYHEDADQSGKSLWDQMMPYLGENFFGRLE